MSLPSSAERGTAAATAATGAEGVALDVVVGQGVAAEAESKRASRYVLKRFDLLCPPRAVSVPCGGYPGR